MLTLRKKHIDKELLLQHDIKLECGIGACQKMKVSGQFVISWHFLKLSSIWFEGNRSSIQVGGNWISFG